MYTESILKVYLKHIQFKFPLKLLFYFTKCASSVLLLLKYTSLSPIQ